MLVTVNYKNKGPRQYDMDSGEIKRLARDFENFLNSGTPWVGVYEFWMVQGGLKSNERIRLEFDNINSIQTSQ